MTDLDTTVRTLLESRKGDWQAIAKEADVSHSWLSKFVRDEIPNPGYATLKKVHDCLTAKRFAKKTPSHF
jgi:transcriptional regulator with XRE-family HTH domain